MPKPKIGKDIVGKSGGAILQTAKEREDFEEWRKKRAGDTVKEEMNEEKEQELHGKEIVSKMPDEREPKPEGLSLEEWAQLKALAKLKKKTQTE